MDHTFVPTWKPLNMLDGTLFFICLLVNMLFLLFSFILTCICIRLTYLVAVYTLNTPITLYCLFLSAENVPLTFGVVLWLSKHQPYLCSNLETSKYVRLSLVCCLLGCRYIGSGIFRHFNLQLHHPHLSCCSLHCKYTKDTLFFVSNHWKYFIYLRCYDLDFKTSTVQFLYLPNLWIC